MTRALSECIAAVRAARTSEWTVHLPFARPCARLPGHRERVDGGGHHRLQIPVSGDEAASRAYVLLDTLGTRCQGSHGDPRVTARPGDLAHRCVVDIAREGLTGRSAERDTEIRRSDEDSVHTGD